MSEDIVLPEDSNLEAEEPTTEVQPTEAPVEEAKVEKVERPVHTVPLSKFNEEREKMYEKGKEEARKEAEAERERLKADYEERLKSSKPQESWEVEVEKVADQYGLEKDAAKALVEAARKSIQMPDTSKFDALIKQQELEALKATVNTEFENKVAPLILKDFPQATPEHLRLVKERIGELAFSEGFNTYKLEDIYKVNRDEFTFKNGYSAEASSGNTTDMIDFSNLTDEQEIELADRDPEMFKKFVKWQSKNQSKFLD